jgi:hypothetical protein
MIFGTTYPEHSKTNYETICTGAVDLESGRLIRIYPVSLRYLDTKFRHYDIIEAKLRRNEENDNRPESYRVDQQSIRVVDNIGTTDGWATRRRHVLTEHNLVSSVEDLWEQQRHTSRSLALVKPKNVKRIQARRKTQQEKEEWEARQKAALSVRDLFVDVEAAVKDLVFMPVEYRLHWTCHGSDCRGHDMSILDWGIYVLSRKMYRDAPKNLTAAERDEHAQGKVVASLERIFGEDHDTYLYLGNTKAHQGNFMIGGLFYPPKQKQLGLQL